MLCYAPMLCYAESNDHWSLRVCPIPNLNLIPVVRLLARPALVMTLDWLLWAADTISIGGVPALQHLYSRGEVGPRRGLHDEEVEEARGARLCCIHIRRRPICMRADQQHCTRGLEGASEWIEIQTPVA